MRQPLPFPFVPAPVQILRQPAFRLLSIRSLPSWTLRLKKSFTEQPARPEEAQAQAQAQEEAHAQEDAQEEAQAQEERLDPPDPPERVPPE